MGDESGAQGHVSAANDQNEALCERCGRCCCRKFIIGGRVYFTPFFCPYNDRNTGLCTVYERRMELNPECIPAEKGRGRGVFPADCPYVRDDPDYQPPVEDFDFFGLGDMAREIARELGVSDEEFDAGLREHHDKGR